MPANPQSLLSPEDQNASFVELFFDLVFVFSVTQVVSLLYHEFHWVGVGQSILVFWLVWWAWTQFTWALNAANTEHHLVEFGTLVATAVAFFMAVAVPGAFHGHGLAFAIPYVLVRAIGLALQILVAREDPVQRNAVRMWTVVSIGGLAAVLAGGVTGGETQYRLWALTVLLDLIAAAVGAHEEGWNLHPDHFAERHGLFVIIALGETLIVAASGLTGAAWTGDSMGVAVLAVATTCALWWTYFPKSKPAMEHAMASCFGSVRSRLARDAFSLLHFPMVCGIIAFATATEAMAAHPTEPLTFGGRLALAAGLLLFVGGMAVAMWRATCGRLWPRAILIAVTAAAVMAVKGVPPTVTLAIAFAGVAAVAGVEQRAIGPVPDAPLS